MHWGAFAALEGVKLALVDINLLWEQARMRTAACEAWHVLVLVICKVSLLAERDSCSERALVV